jgi:hypothetical protein
MREVGEGTGELMSENNFDHRYASSDKVQALETRVAVIETQTLSELKALGKQNDRIEAMLNQRQQPNTTALDQASLALQHLASKLADPSPRSGGRISNYAIAALVGGMAMLLGAHQLGWHF